MMVITVDACDDGGHISFTPNIFLSEGVRQTKIVRTVSFPFSLFFFFFAIILVIVHLYRVG